jgi:SAM-dependent methyltransferase
MRIPSALSSGLLAAALAAATAGCSDVTPSRGGTDGTAQARPGDAAATAAAAAAAATDPAPAGAYGRCDATPDGTGVTYFGREIAHYMTHHGIPWLERDSRESEERTSALLDALDLRPGLCVADIGAGSGRLTVPIARRVAPGIAFGTDIQPEMLAFLEARARTEGLANLKGILGDTDDVMLPAGTVDLVLLVDAYHEFDRPWEMTRSIVRALRPGGRVALVEFRAEDPEVPIKALHKMTEAQARRELEAAGLRWIRTDPRLPWQHLLWFEKPADGGGKINPG